ncbi:hypothetical protein BT63DRAFT_15408 [Microthyrium microscopicum]|uniref:GRF-type domain-containing protein n=1 Tax=Microthyrium microscopicum TaxID=703497 RepID=A0A6A6UQR0_9PEZI|nr:hypothetical protein BT63DRAFT_15408 [Microthyrium microscopicum]
MFQKGGFMGPPKTTAPSRMNGRGGGGYRRGQNNNRSTKLTGLYQNGQWMCECKPRLPASLFQVKKENQNKGKWFFVCQKSNEKRCSFFLWRDAADMREKQAVLSNTMTEDEPAGMTNAPPANARYSTLPAPNPFLNNTQNTADILPADTASRDSKSYAVSDAKPRSFATTITDPSFEMSTEDEQAMMALDTQDLGRGSQASAQSTMSSTVRSMGQIVPGATTPNTKRTFQDMVGVAGGLPTPETHKRQQMSRQTNAQEDRNELLDLASPMSTPTPASRNLPAEGQQLLDDVMGALREENVQIWEKARSRLKSVCDIYARRAKGVVHGREVLRKSLIARDSKIAELQQRIITLEAELDTEREVIRYLREASEDK